MNPEIVVLFFKNFRVIPCLFLLLLLSNPLNAQLSHTGAVSGTITAPDGSLIGAVSVTLAIADAPARVTSTSADGTFSINDLPSGIYTLKATAPGFAVYTHPSVSVAIGRNTHLLITLAVAGSQETVSVTANQAYFDTSQTSSVVNIDRDRVEELPIPSRNYLTFVLLSPQVAPANPTLAQQTLTQGNGGFSFGGLRPGSNAAYFAGRADDDGERGGNRTQ